MPVIRCFQLTVLREGSRDAVWEQNNDHQEEARFRVQCRSQGLAAAVR